MITVVQPNTLGTLKSNDKFKFEGDDSSYYFIGNYGVGGYVYWDDKNKKVKTIVRNNYDEYLKTKVYVESINSIPGPPPPPLDRTWREGTEPPKSRRNL